MKKIVVNTFKYLFFLAVGLVIFWFIYRKIEGPKLVSALKGLKYHWLIISIGLGLLSHFSRAMRWKMLIKPMGYNPNLFNTFLSILIMYFGNLVIPRAGEVVRCSVVSGTEKIPFTKLIGTVFIERLADVIMLFILAVIIFATNLSIVTRFFDQHPMLLDKLGNLYSFKVLLILIAAIILGIAAFIYLRRRFRMSSKKGRLVSLKNQFIDGIKSIAHMEHKWLFIGHTLFIFLMWLLMLYVVFLAYQPTEHLSVRTGMVVFLMGGLAMLAPVQGGIGPWHFMVIETLILYDIPKTEGSIFALVAHSTTNLIYILLGGSAVIYLIYKYGNKVIRFRRSE